MENVLLDAHYVGKNLINMFKLTALATGSGVITALLVSHSDRLKAYATSKQGIPVDNRNTASKWDRNWDFRDPSPKEGEEVTKPTAKRTLILIRHGQYETWHDDRDKKVLTELGREQARLTGQRLRALSKNYAVLLHSTMPRARETAQLISECLPNVPTSETDLLREGAPIRPEPPSKRWRPEEYEFFRDGARIEAAFRKLFHRAKPSQKEDSVEIVVCHANVIRYFVLRALQLPPEAWLRMSLAHGSLTRVVITPVGGVHVTEIGNSGHLPPDKVTFT